MYSVGSRGYSGDFWLSILAKRFHMTTYKIFHSIDNRSWEVSRSFFAKSDTAYSPHRMDGL